MQAFVLTGSHYHLILETPDANLSAFARAINSDYTTVSTSSGNGEATFSRDGICQKRKHTPVSSTDIVGFFGNISCSAVTKVAARLKGKMREDKMLREEMDRIEKGLSDVNG